jgi:hypothetical protein
MLKYLLSAGESKIPENFVNSAIQQLPEMEDKTMTMVERLRQTGKTYLLDRLDHEIRLRKEAQARIQGLSEEAKVTAVIDAVREEGKEKSKIQVARKMKADGMAIENISEFTELSQAVIEGL